MLRTQQFILDERETWIDEVHNMLQAMAWAYRTTVSTSTHHSPGELVFNRDMIMNLAITIDWATIANARRNISQRGVTRENATRLSHNYRVGERVLIIMDASERRSQRKIGEVTKGPYMILKINPNGTVEIQRDNYRETISIRRIKPFRE